MKYLLSSIAIIPSLLSAMTINEAVQQTIVSNPQVHVSQAELQTQKKLLGATKSDYLPKLDISYSVGPESTKTIANSRTKVNLNREEAAINLTQNLFAGFDTKYAVEGQKALIISADAGVADKASAIALQTTTAYLNILRNQELFDIATDNVKVHKKYLDQIKEKVDAGVGTNSDYEQTLSRYENAQSLFYLSEQNYKNSITTFQRLLPVEATAQDLEKPTMGDLPAQNIEDALSIALQNNPAIKISLADRTFAKSSISRSDAANYPKVDLTAKAYWDKNLNGISNSGVGAHSPYESNSGYNALLVLSYNIFNGLADKANKEANEARYLKQNSTLADSKRFVEANTKIAWQTIESTTQQLVHIDKNIAASANTVKSYREEHDLGRRSIIDLLNIELEYTTALNSKVTAEYDRLVAYYQLLTHTGSILGSMNVTVK